MTPLTRLLGLLLAASAALAPAARAAAEVERGHGDYWSSPDGIRMSVDYVVYHDPLSAELYRVVYACAVEQVIELSTRIRCSVTAHADPSDPDIDWISFESESEKPGPANAITGRVGFNEDIFPVEDLQVCVTFLGGPHPTVCARRVT